MTESGSGTYESPFAGGAGKPGNGKAHAAPDEVKRTGSGPGLDPDHPDAEREPAAAKAAAHAFAPIAVSQLYDETPEEIEWLWEGFVPVGALVLLAAFMKAGKTTITYALIAALARGEPFLQRKTRRSKVLLLALEENRRDVKRRLMKFGVERDAGLFIQFRPVPTAPSEWASLVEFIRTEGIGLVVIDTLSRCWPVWGVDNENDNARVAAAMSPTLDLCRDQRVTVLLLHHAGKISEKGFGGEIRGAGAILALADQALLFDRYRVGDPCDRVIKVLGRYDESPGETVIRYDKASGTYELASKEAQPTDQASAVEELYPKILTYLRKQKETGTTKRDLRSNVYGANPKKDIALGRLIDQGKVVLHNGKFYHADHTGLLPILEKE